MLTLRMVLSTRRSYLGVAHSFVLSKTAKLPDVNAEP